MVIMINSVWNSPYSPAFISTDDNNDRVISCCILRERTLMNSLALQSHMELILNLSYTVEYGACLMGEHMDVDLQYPCRS